jgi:hypothetical protein
MVQAKKDGTVWHEGNGTTRQLVELFGRLEAARAGCTGIRAVNSVSGGPTKDTWAEDVNFEGKNDRGEPIAFLGRFTFDKSGLTLVESHVSPRK